MNATASPHLESLADEAVTIIREVAKTSGKESSVERAMAAAVSRCSTTRLASAVAPKAGASFIAPKKPRALSRRGDPASA